MYNLINDLITALALISFFETSNSFDALERTNLTSSPFNLNSACKNPRCLSSIFTGVVRTLGVVTMTSQYVLGMACCAKTYKSTRLRCDSLSSTVETACHEESTGTRLGCELPSDYTTGSRCQTGSEIQRHLCTQRLSRRAHIASGFTLSCKKNVCNQHNVIFILINLSEAYP